MRYNTTMRARALAISASALALAVSVPALAHGSAITTWQVAGWKAGTPIVAASLASFLASLAYVVWIGF